MLAKRDKEWVRCGKCGHKLFRTWGKTPSAMLIPSEQFVEGVPHRGKDGIEIKCHSCKTLNIWAE